LVRDEFRTAGGRRRAPARDRRDGHGQDQDEKAAQEIATLAVIDEMEALGLV
jgi:hypothetical protein